MTKTRIPIEERFWKFVNKTDECWLWTGATNYFGYGMINTGGHNGTAMRAHRLSWVIHNGNIPNGYFVCHRCDNPLCVRPDHLFLGTNADNNNDMHQKGRNNETCHPRGINHWRTKFSEQDILDIRSTYATGHIYLRELGNKYDVSITTIWHIVKRHVWTHI